MNTNPYQPVIDLEMRLAEWCGSKYCVSTDSGTSALFLSLQYRKHQLGAIEEVTIPNRTYVSVPCSIIHSGGKVKFSDEEWQGEYELSPYNIWDSALRFHKGMYGDKGKSGGLQCLSGHIKKRLNIGRAGFILTDDLDALIWLRRARFDGRDAVPLLSDNFYMLGWNCYLTPEQAARGIQLFELIRNKELPDLPVEKQGYPDLSKYKIYTK